MSRLLRHGFTAAALAAASARAQAPIDACQPDERLAHAAAELLLRGDPKPEAEVLVAAVRAAGSEAVALHAVFVDASAGAAPVRAWLEQRRARADAALVCGSASSERGRLVISSAKGGELAVIDPGARVVRGALAPGFANAELVVASADGELVRVGVTPAALRDGIRLDESLLAPLTVQLVATGTAGPRPIAERVVEAVGPQRAAASPRDGDWQESTDFEELGQPRRSPSRSARRSSEAMRAPGGSVASEARGNTLARGGADRSPVGSAEPATPSPSEPAGKVASGPSERDDEQDPAGDLAKLVLGLRSSQGRGTLRDNRLLREAANTHARDVCKEGRVAHELAHGQDPPARLAAAGLAAQLVGEAIARARDAASAFDALQRSPSHRLTMLDRRFTDVGVGRASDDAGKSCFVVLLCAWPRYVGR